MSQVIIYMNPEKGNVAICYPTGELPIEDVRDKDCPFGAEIVDRTALPPEEDMEFFDAWRLNLEAVDPPVVIDMPAARDIWRNKMRAKRAPLLAELDTQYQRATEIGADLTAIVAHKQALRDVTDDPGIEAAETTEELRAVWPEVLDQPITEVPLPTVPQIISDRQFFQEAAIMGVVTQAEAIAAVSTGAIPAVLQTIVDGIEDPNQKFAATMLLSGATLFERYHPFTNAVGAALGWTSDEVDQFFVQAAKL